MTRAQLAKAQAGRRAPGHHVQFYAKDAVMLDQVGRFLKAGLDAGEAGIVIGTPAHNQGLRERLGSSAQACTFLDAGQTMAGFLDGDGVDLARFEATVGESVRAATRRGNGRVRAFGEMVALLCAQGRPATAVELERVWNGLAGTVPLTLLCAYPMSAFPGKADRATLAEVCDEHTVIEPAEGGDDGDPAARIARLQQELHSLRQDIARQQALATHDPRDEALRDFIEQAPVGMHKVDADGTILWANQRELDLLGYRREEYVGRNVCAFHEDPEVPRAIIAKVLQGQAAHGVRSSLLRKDGTFLPALIDSNGVFHDGRFLRTRCIVRPIEDLVSTERARDLTERSLVQRERQQALIARVGRLALDRSSLDEFFAVVCADLARALGADTCGLMECIPGTTELRYRAGHGFPDGFMARVPGGPGTQSGFVLASRAPVVYDDLANEARFTPAPKLLEAGIRSGMSVAIPTSRGAWGTIGVHMRTLRGFRPEDTSVIEAVAHVLGSAIERREGESELQRNRDDLEALVRERTARLEQANRELDAFTSAVSHDLRGPVRAIAGFSALLAQRHAGRLDPHGRELLEEVRRAAARMGDLIEDLLDLSRADRMLPSRTTVDLSALARDILRLEAERHPSRHVHCDVDPDLVVQGDADLLRMALENLLANAWKFTARAHEARISVTKRGEGEDMVLCVQDNGAGFDMADAGRLFQPFQRLHRRSEYDGTGIGLATVRRIIERHGGRIWAQGKPGVGAAFYFTLPSGPVPVSDAAEARLPPLPGDAVSVAAVPAPAPDARTPTPSVDT